MLATLAFEKNTVLLRDAAAMSIYRYATCSPWTMAFPVLRGTKSSKNIVTILLVLLLSSVTVLSQFISTILITDAGPAILAGRIDKLSISYGVEAIPNVIHINGPQVFPRFAERTGTPIALAENLKGRGIRGTGRTLRAFLPLSPPNRTSLLRYDGIAGVMEANVLCTSPDPVNISYVMGSSNYNVTGHLGLGYLQQLSGRLQSQNYFRFNSNQSFTDLGPFNCNPFGNMEGLYTLCPLPFNAVTKCMEKYFSEEYCLGTPKNKWLLVLKQGQLSRNVSLPMTGYKLNGTEWTTIYFADGASFDMTVCVMPVETAYANITAETNTTATEPAFGSSTSIFDQSDEKGNTAGIRNQFATGRSFEERGIMDFQLQADDVDRLFANTIYDWGSFFYDDLEFANKRLIDDDLIILNSIFNTIVDSLSILDALQTVYTITMSQSYYSHLLQANNSYYNWYSVLQGTDGHPWINIQTTISQVQDAKSVYIPQGKRGLFIVCAIIGLHFFSVVLVFWMYFTCHAPKFLDQAWHTIGQLHNGDAKEFLCDSASLGDRDVSKLQAAIPKWDKPVEIGKSGINCKSTSYAPLPGTSSAR
jgi:hypothetical protein